jgi:putative RNA 2'-phosphotransferase
MERELVSLSKTISHALRHAPWLYELELDDQGWVSLADLLAALHQRPRWQKAGETEIRRIMAESDKQRFELHDGKIRALYGHSVPERLAKEAAAPPAILYHGTSDQVLPIIKAEGLKPMRRQYVHLSTDVPTAEQVASRKAGHSIILKVQAGEAHQKGVVFYRGNSQVWLADFVPPEFLSE